MGEERSDFAAAIDAIVADCNDRLEWLRFSKDHVTKAAARVLMSCWIQLRLGLELLA